MDTDGVHEVKIVVETLIHKLWILLQIFKSLKTNTETTRQIMQDFGQE